MRNKDNDTGQVRAQRPKNLLDSNEKYTHGEERQERKIKHVSSVFCFSFAAQLWAYCVVLLTSVCAPPHTHTTQSSLARQSCKRTHKHALSIS